jgi:hypothetical protein
MTAECNSFIALEAQMTFPTKVGLVFSTTLLMACGSSGLKYLKAGVSDAESERDRKECLVIGHKVSRGEMDGSSYGYSSTDPTATGAEKAAAAAVGGFAQGWAQGQRRSEVMEACLKQRGYEKVQAAADPPIAGFPENHERQRVWIAFRAGWRGMVG